MMDTGIFDALEEENLLLIAAVSHRKKKRPQPRTKWVHEILKKRERYGEYHWLVQELRLDRTRFQNYFRVSPTEFEFLANVLCLLGYHIYILTTYIFEEQITTYKLLPYVFLISFL